MPETTNKSPALKRLAMTVAVCAMLAGCAGNGRLTPGFTTTQASNDPTYIGVQTAELTCPPPKDGEKIASVPAALIGFAADFAVNLGGELLKDLQKNRSAVYAATGVAGEHCLPGLPTKAIAVTAQTGELMIARMAKDIGGNPYNNPAFQLDGRTTLIGKRSADGKSNLLQISFQATRLNYGQAAPRRGGKRKRVVVLLQFSDKAPLGAAEPDKDVELAGPLRIDLGDVEEGFVYNAAMLNHVSGSVVIPYPENTRPVITAVVFETEDESIALRALSGAYDSNKDKLIDLITGALGASDD